MPADDIVTRLSSHMTGPPTCRRGCIRGLPPALTAQVNIDVAAMARRPAQGRKPPNQIYSMVAKSILRFTIDVTAETSRIQSIEAAEIRDEPSTNPQRWNEASRPQMSRGQRTSTWAVLSSPATSQRCGRPPHHARRRPKSKWARDECSVARSYMATDQRNSTSMSVQWSSYWKPTMSKGTEQVRPLCGREANDMNVNVARTRNAHTLRSREAAVMILTQLCGA